jgi:hypothetical protein
MHKKKSNPANTTQYTHHPYLGGDSSLEFLCASASLYQKLPHPAGALSEFSL